MIMGQINIHLTPEFEFSLGEFMRLRAISTKSEAVRVAVSESLDRVRARPRSTDFAEWVGAGLEAPENPSPRFRSDDDLWR